MRVIICPVVAICSAADHESRCQTSTRARTSPQDAQAGAEVAPRVSCCSSPRTLLGLLVLCVALTMTVVAAMAMNGAHTARARAALCAKLLIPSCAQINMRAPPRGRLPLLFQYQSNARLKVALSESACFSQHAGILHAGTVPDRIFRFRIVTIDPDHRHDCHARREARQVLRRRVVLVVSSAAAD